MHGVMQPIQLASSQASHNLMRPGPAAPISKRQKRVNSSVSTGSTALAASHPPMSSRGRSHIPRQAVDAMTVPADDEQREDEEDAENVEGRNEDRLDDRSYSDQDDRIDSPAWSRSTASPSKKRPRRTASSSAPQSRLAVQPSFTQSRKPLSKYAPAPRPDPISASTLFIGKTSPVSKGKTVETSLDLTSGYSGSSEQLIQQPLIDNPSLHTTNLMDVLAVDSGREGTNDDSNMASQIGRIDRFMNLARDQLIALSQRIDALESSRFHSQSSLAGVQSSLSMIEQHLSLDSISSLHSLASSSALPPSSTRSLPSSSSQQLHSQPHPLTLPPSSASRHNSHITLDYDDELQMQRSDLSLASHNLHDANAIAGPSQLSLHSSSSLSLASVPSQQRFCSNPVSDAANLASAGKMATMLHQYHRRAVDRELCVADDEVEDDSFTVVGYNVRAAVAPFLPSLDHLDSALPMQLQSSDLDDGYPLDIVSAAAAASHHTTIAATLDATIQRNGTQDVPAKLPKKRIAVKASRTSKRAAGSTADLSVAGIEGDVEEVKPGKRARKPELSRVVRATMFKLLAIDTTSTSATNTAASGSVSASTVDQEYHGYTKAPTLPNFSEEVVFDAITGLRLWRWEWDKTIRQSPHNAAFSIAIRAQVLADRLASAGTGGMSDDVPADDWDSLDEAIESAYTNLRREKEAQMDPKKRQAKDDHRKRNKKRGLKEEKCRRRSKALNDGSKRESEFIQLTTQEIQQGEQEEGDCDDWSKMSTSKSRATQMIDMNIALELRYMSSEDEIDTSDPSTIPPSYINLPLHPSSPYDLSVVNANANDDEASNAASAPIEAGQKVFAIYRPSWRSSILERTYRELDALRPPERSYRRLIGPSREDYPPEGTPPWMMTREWASKVVARRAEEELEKKRMAANREEAKAAKKQEKEREKGRRGLEKQKQRESQSKAEGKKAALATRKGKGAPATTVAAQDSASETKEGIEKLVGDDDMDTGMDVVVDVQTDGDG